MKLRKILLEETEEPERKSKYFASVAVVGHGTKWLLGLSKASDCRKDLWCFPGGGIKNGEEPDKAAERECKEETGVSCHAVSGIFELPNKPGVAFIRCRAESLKLRPNGEFAALGWYTRREMKALKLYHNVYKLLDRVTN